MGPSVRLILLVEDEYSDAVLLERALRQAGVTAPVVRVNNGEAAVNYLRNAGMWSGSPNANLPELMILDLKLPRQSGFEVLESLRNMPGGMRRLPVIVLSSSNEPKDVDRAYELGANSYLTKPTTTHEYAEMASAFRDYWLVANQDPSLAISSTATRN